MKVGVFGGTFDPVHTGHLIAASEAKEKLELDQVIFVPAGQPWLKASRHITPARHRLAMVELAIGSNRFFAVSDAEVTRRGPSYSVDTLEEIGTRYGRGASLYLLLGSELLQELHMWHDPGRLFDLATVVAISRPGFEQCDLEFLSTIHPDAASRIVRLDVTPIGISSSRVRDRVSMGMSVKYLVPEAVERYVQENALYVELGGRAARTGVGGSAAEHVLRVAKGNGALSFGEYELSSGAHSSYYFDGRLITLDPEGAYWVARAFLPILRECRAETVAGPTLGADPIVSAVAAISYQQGHPIPGLIVRKEQKPHGAQRAIEGPLKPGARVAVADDTCTSGASLLAAIDALEAEGCSVVKVMCILDRHQGGSDDLKRRGYDFVALLEAGEDGEVRVALP